MDLDVTVGKGGAGRSRGKGNHNQDTLREKKELISILKRALNDYYFWQTQSQSEQVISN